MTEAGGMTGVGRVTAFKLAQQRVGLALRAVRRADDLPPAEVHTGRRGLDSVAEKVQALGQPAELEDIANMMSFLAFEGAYFIMGQACNE